MLTKNLKQIICEKNGPLPCTLPCILLQTRHETKIYLQVSNIMNKNVVFIIKHFKGWFGVLLILYTVLWVGSSGRSMGGFYKGDAEWHIFLLGVEKKRDMLSEKVNSCSKGSKIGRVPWCLVIMSSETFFALKYKTLNLRP